MTGDVATDLHIRLVWKSHPAFRARHVKVHVATVYTPANLFKHSRLRNQCGANGGVGGVDYFPVPSLHVNQSSEGLICVSVLGKGQPRGDHIGGGNNRQRSQVQVGTLTRHAYSVKHGLVVAPLPRRRLGNKPP